jgi:Holliday junction DNA helicase RuvA
VIAGLRGTIAQKTDDSILVDVSGVIYRVGTSTNTLAETGAVGDLVELLTTLVVREDALTLFGFATAEEHRFFDILTAVSGIGPRLACAVLSTFRPEGLFAAVQAGDVDLIATIPGVGKKSASRMIVELSGKLPEAQFARDVVMHDRDVVEALRSLGYSSAEVQEALVRTRIDEGMSTEERIVAALQQLGVS